MKYQSLFFSCVATACAGGSAGPGPAPELIVAVERLVPSNESLNASAVSVVLSVQNPSNTAIGLEKIVYAIDTQDVAGIVKGEVASGAKIDAAQTAEVRFKVEVEFPEGAEPYRALIARGNFPYALTGTVFQTDGTEIAFERRGQLATPTLPKFVVHEAQAAKYGAEGIEVTWYLRLVNENAFPVLIERVSYAVFLGDREIKKEQAALGERILANSSEEYEVSTSVDGSGDRKEELKRFLSAGRVPYRVAGQIDISRSTIPFEYTAEIELAQSE